VRNEEVFPRSARVGGPLGTRSTGARVGREIVGADRTTLTANTKVRFELQEGEYGLEAKNVTFSTV
jgi:hypothetical protein